ncbi:hypothetical protein [Nordella sp. HKS 07]|uniref:hypothetical protein n=1 Tax=Nordella sp. HKS 07 TaxID=2712222 RepID=UPI001FEFAAA5|nr:hypothetical protein [Nordella sp. HKS 07]
MENPELGDFEAHLGAAEEARHVGLAEEIAGCVAVVAAAQPDEIFAARELRFLGPEAAGNRHQGGDGQQRGEGAATGGGRRGSEAGLHRAIPPGRRDIIAAA